MEPVSDSVMIRFGVRWQLAMVLAFNSLVGVLLTLAAGPSVTAHTLWLLSVCSQSVGFSMFGLVHLAAWWAGRAGRPLPRDFAIGVVVGALVGNVLGALLAGAEFTATQFASYIFIALAFGGFIAYFFFATIRMAQGQWELHQQEAHRLTAEAQLLETRLRLLQAQIEPHFLFNTLSNIHGLIGVDPPRAARMLESLTRLLRASLKRTRAGDTTLGDELALVRAYLEIQAERMGSRLRFVIDVPEELASLPLPPLLIQPLVENAVQHGIEPAVEGGTISIRASRGSGGLRVEVEDSGRGLAGEGQGHGLGLANVAERLSARFGAGATLQMDEMASGGVRAVITLPLPFSERSAV